MSHRSVKRGLQIKTKSINTAAFHQRKTCFYGKLDKSIFFVSKSKVQRKATDVVVVGQGRVVVFVVRVFVVVGRRVLRRVRIVASGAPRRVERRPAAPFCRGRKRKKTLSNKEETKKIERSSRTPSPRATNQGLGFCSCPLIRPGLDLEASTIRLGWLS